MHLKNAFSQTILLLCLLFLSSSLSCTTPSAEKKVVKDTVSIPAAREVEDIPINKANEDIIDVEELILNPYDFVLNLDSISSLLGPAAITRVENVEGGEDDQGHFDAYTVFTVHHENKTFADTEIRFYNTPGRHQCVITDKKLPIKYGIRIGMPRKDFSVKFSDPPFTDSTSYSIKFSYSTNYGYADFIFLADTLARFNCNRSPELNEGGD
jgi:hypothetical protein